MYYKITAELKDKMRVYEETPLDVKPFNNVTVRKEIRSPWERDYFTIENGSIKLISGRRNKTEFDGAKIEYPKGTKEISLFLEKNKGSLFPMSEELFLKDYKINQHRNNLLSSLIGIDMSIEDLRKRIDYPPTPEEKRGMNRLWNERDKITREIFKLDKKEKLLLSGKQKKQENNMER